MRIGYPLLAHGLEHVTGLEEGGVENYEDYLAFRRELERARGEAVAVALAARLWRLVDDLLEDTMSTAARDFDGEALQAALDSREAGWEQVPWRDGDWPPLDGDLTVTLRREQWRFLLHRCESWIVTKQQTGEHQALALSRHARDVIGLQLDPPRA